MLSFLTLNEDDELFDVLTDVVDGATLVSGRVGQVGTENEETVSIDEVVEVRLCNDVTIPIASHLSSYDAGKGKYVFVLSILKLFLNQVTSGGGSPVVGHRSRTDSPLITSTSSMTSPPTISGFSTTINQDMSDNQ